MQTLLLHDILDILSPPKKEFSMAKSKKIIPKTSLELVLSTPSKQTRDLRFKTGGGPHGVKSERTNRRSENRKIRNGQYD